MNQQTHVVWTHTKIQSTFFAWESKQEESDTIGKLKK